VWSAFAKKKGLGRKPAPAVHDDLVKRHLKAVKPDLVWLTDITEHWTNEGKLYMCAFKDVCSRRIVGYAMSDRMTSALAVRALDNAVTGRDHTRRYTPEFKELAVRLVMQLREELGQEQGTIQRIAEQLGCGTESLRSWVKQIDITAVPSPV
jgi:transposase InsO family protein